MPRGRKPDEEALRPPRDMEPVMFLGKKIFVVTLAPAVGIHRAAPQSGPPREVADEPGCLLLHSRLTL